MKNIIILLFIFFLMRSIAFASYEVKGKGVSSVVYGGGKVTSSKSTDEVVYVVDLDSNTVTRTGVFNSGIKDGPLSGLQADNTIYQIVYNENTLITGKRNASTQPIIKAIGRTGMTDGYETIVVGEDFIATSNSKFDYFVLYYYKRAQ